MSTVAEITEALPGLNDDELRRVERALMCVYRQRKTGIIFDDSYGTFTEEDLAAINEEALRIIDDKPSQK